MWNGSECSIEPPFNMIRNIGTDPDFCDPFRVDSPEVLRDPWVANRAYGWRFLHNNVDPEGRGETCALHRWIAIARLYRHIP